MPGVRIVTRPKLALSQDPSAELAAAALQAAEAANLQTGAGDYLVIAVPAGQADDNLARELEAVITAHGQRLLDAGVRL